MSLEHWWNNTDKGNLKYSEKDVSRSHFVITNLTWNDLGSKPNLRGGGGGGRGNPLVLGVGFDP